MALTSAEESLFLRSFEIGVEKRKVLVFDDLFEINTLSAIYNKFKSLPYRLADYDRDDTKTIRHLVHAFEAEEAKANEIRNTVLAVRELAAGQGIALKYPVKIYANFNLHGDYQFAHEDGDVWTTLVFVNSLWNEDWGGELLLYDGTFAKPTDRGFAYAIAPRPGRIVLFDGRIKHRGGVPSKYCSEPRITLAIKFWK